ncbi:MAG: hypothetical protein U0835_23170 [Isosphaeraceae bacterium]
MCEFKPPFRPARQISESEGDEAISSGDPERIRYALIDGSRCLDDAWVMRHAWALAAHSDPGVRWAAVFAIDQARSTWVPTLVDDFEPIHVLDQLMTNEPDASVRGMLATTMTDVISMLVSALRPGDAA